jgi:RimJ/RimL family protein N-acetyltransferase
MPQFEIAPTLVTQRLALRAHRIADFDLLAHLFTTDRSRHIGGPLNEQDVWAGFMNAVGQWAVSGFGGWGIELRETGQCVGQVAISRPVEFPEIELGWLLFEGQEGKGYAFEAATRARDFAFGELGLSTLFSYVDPDNARSRHLAERLGGQRDPSAATPNGDPTWVYRYEPVHPTP